MIRKSRSGTALLALSVAACVATAMLSIYLDLERKLHKEFRTYGANVVIAGKDGQSLGTDELKRIKSVLPAQAIAVPFAYAAVHTRNNVSLVVVGTDLNGVRQLNQWWSVTNWPSAPRQVLVGARVQSQLGDREDDIALWFGEKRFDAIVMGSLVTGADEEQRIYMSLPEFESWTGVQPLTIEISVPGSRDEINGRIKDLAAAVPNAQVRPIRQIVDAEAGVISKTRLLMLTAVLLIAATVCLCVLATLTSSVLERRRDFAVMKALGSSQAVLNVIFASEAALLGAVGGLIGFLTGAGLAAWIGRVNFNAMVLPPISVFPTILAGTIILALVAALFPLLKLQDVEPAGILKGE